VGGQPSGHRRDSLGPKNGRAVVRPAGGVSESIHVLAAVEVRSGEKGNRTVQGDG
jgi:hypothetical protein